MSYKNFRQQVKNILVKIDTDSEVNLKEFSHFIKWSLDKEKTPADTAQEILTDALKRYDVFIRTWWSYDNTGKRVPIAGDKNYLSNAQLTRAEARAFCEKWNDEHDPGELSLKAEFEES